MKINVQVFHGDHDRTFEISCGTGENKSFKWLSNVACQRFALAAPNGALRHRDHFRGITDAAQYPAVEICLPDGEIPHPASMLSDFLRDGDSVILRLGDKLSVESKSGAPVLSKWATVAFTSSAHENEDDGDEMEHDHDETDPAERINIKSKAEFMKLVLCSQIVNQKKIDHLVNSHWPTITTAMPQLCANDTNQFRIVFQRHWSTMLELFQLFADEGRMNAEKFRIFLDEISLFSMKDSIALTNKVHARTCRATQSTGHLDIGSLMVALLLCAQLRHNDTLEHKSHVKSSADALEEIFERNIMGYAERQGLPSVLKGYFNSDEFLFGIREYHTDLLSVYESYAVRSHELPTSLQSENMAELLFDAKLQSEGDVKRTQQLFADVRKGIIIGRQTLPPPENGLADEPIPEDEFTYAEYVEVGEFMPVYPNDAAFQKSVILCFLLKHLHVNKYRH